MLGTNVLWCEVFYFFLSSFLFPNVDILDLKFKFADNLCNQDDPFGAVSIVLNCSA